MLCVTVSSTVESSVKSERTDVTSDDSCADSDDKSREPSSSTPLSKLDGASTGKRSR